MVVTDAIDGKSSRGFRGRLWATDIEMRKRRDNAQIEDEEFWNLEYI